MRFSFIPPATSILHSCPLPPSLDRTHAGPNGAPSCTSLRHALSANIFSIMKSATLAELLTLFLLFPRFAFNSDSNTFTWRNWVHVIKCTAATTTTTDRILWQRYVMPNESHELQWVSWLRPDDTCWKCPLAYYAAANECDLCTVIRPHE